MPGGSILMTSAPKSDMIALTDGNDNASAVPPTEAARVARDREITIHTIAMGDPTTVGDDLTEAVTANSDANLVTVKTLASGDATPDEGDTVTFQIEVTNNGAAQATSCWCPSGASEPLSPRKITRVFLATPNASR